MAQNFTFYWFIASMLFVLLRSDFCGFFAYCCQISCS